MTVYYCTAAEAMQTAGMSDLLDATDGFTTEEVESMINDAESEIEEVIFHRYFREVTITAEKQYGKGGREMWVEKLPIISVTSLDINGTAITVGSLDIDLKRGKIILTTASEKQYFTSASAERDRGITITYKSGSSEVPGYIRKLCRCIAAIDVIGEYLGRNYDEIKSEGVGSRSITHGGSENMRDRITELEKQKDEIIKRRAPLIRGITIDSPRTYY